MLDRVADRMAEVEDLPETVLSLVGRFPGSAFLQFPLTLIAVVVGSWLVLAPVALYLAFSRD